MEADGIIRRGGSPNVYWDTSRAASASASDYAEASSDKQVPADKFRPPLSMKGCRIEQSRPYPLLLLDLSFASLSPSEMLTAPKRGRSVAF